MLNFLSVTVVHEIVIVCRRSSVYPVIWMRLDVKVKRRKR